jgi:hypothetical protein
MKSPLKGSICFNSWITGTLVYSHPSQRSSLPPQWGRVLPPLRIPILQPQGSSAIPKESSDFATSPELASRRQIPCHNG